MEVQVKGEGYTLGFDEEEIPLTVLSDFVLRKKVNLIALSY